MKIQGLAILSIIIILPMVILLSQYSDNQISTLRLQNSYDSKLTSATYDAIKVFQLNMSNSSTSDLANSKIRDIKASINTFYNSLASNFNMSGYGESVLKNYVPAVVYTLYDGYYIYSAYKNTLDSNDTFDSETLYQEGDMIYGLKPYIYYSCRYKGTGYDIVINYSLDSYITIHGIINGKEINDAGYLLTGVTGTKNTATGDYTNIKYRGINIVSENSKLGLMQNIYVENDTTGPRQISFGVNQIAGSIFNCQYRKINGVKYYKHPTNRKSDGSDNEVFAIINDEKYIQNQANSSIIDNNDNGWQYYNEALKFKERIQSYGLLGLKSNSAVDSYGNAYSDEIMTKNYQIFGELNATGTYLEDADSDFNAHKMEVIRNSIETNLMTAISNYNKVSTSSVNFAMPKLQDTEWEKITQNVSMITFLQGLNIGGRVYNGYSIVPNNSNEEYVSEDSIYILANDGEYHKVTELGLESKLDGNSIGILNTDFMRKTGEATYKIMGPDGKEVKETLTKTVYYYPRNDLASYTSIISSNGNISTEPVYDYLATPGKETLAQIYYTALGRERYGQYRVANKLEEVQEIFK